SWSWCWFTERGSERRTAWRVSGSEYEREPVHSECRRGDEQDEPECSEALRRIEVLASAHAIAVGKVLSRLVDAVVSAHPTTVPIRHTVATATCEIDTASGFSVILGDPSARKHLHPVGLAVWNEFCMIRHC